jgi:hypothetical protein
MTLGRRFELPSDQPATMVVTPETAIPVGAIPAVTRAEAIQAATPEADIPDAGTLEAVAEAADMEEAARTLKTTQKCNRCSTLLRR